MERNERIFDIEINMAPEKVVNDIKEMICKNLNYQAISREEKILSAKLEKKLTEVLTELVLARKSQIE